MVEKRGVSDRFLTTVLMTDIVGSTEHAAEVGDSAWRQLVAEHHRIVRAALRRHGGRELDTAGDGFFAVFDAPAAAVVCALEIAEKVRALGIDIRAGVHVGEVEQAGRKVGGIAVPIAARIMSAADRGEVLVSGTARDLATGAGLRFEDRGTRELKGVPGEWHIYAAAGAGAGASASDAGETDAATRRAAAVRRARSRPIWQRRRGLVAAAVGGLAIAVAAGALLVLKPWQPPALARITDNSVGVIDSGRSEIIASIPVGAQPGGVAIADGVAWVTNTGANNVSQIDVATRTATRITDVGRGPLGVVAGGGSIWVANSGDRTVSRINATNGRVVDTISVGNGPVALAHAGGSVWVANLRDSTLLRIDAASGAVGEPVPVGAGPVALAADDTGLWALSADAALVTHLDATSGVTLAAPIALPSRPTAIATGAGQVWVASADGTVTRIEPATHRVTATVDVGGSLSAVVAGADAVWVADRSGSLVVRIDPANSAAAGRRITTASEPEALGLNGGEVWVAARSSPTTHRGGTLRVASLTLPATDPTGLFDELTQFEADGLMAYRRAGGAAGTLLVPDLAVAIPKPTDGGRSYAFQLRPNLEYSTGEQVLASHFRRAIERGFQVADAFFGAFGGDYFSAIVGAEACITPDRSPVARCDLAAGITTDDGANTITFELSRPDPDFLYSLASPLAYPVADGVAMDGPVEGTFPGTGPYVVASHSQTEVRLARNLNFTPWHPDARSGGFVDEIVWTAVDGPDAAVEMVERGDADFTRLSLDNRVSPEVLARLRSATGAELHFASNNVTSVTMNTTLAPFDNLAARQAVNMAIDRALIADRHGGPLSAAVTCQVVPPGWSGYQPYCPYTTHPDPGGRWQAPDLEAARRLVDQSGTRGARVIVGPTFGFFGDTRDYLVTLLQELGYDASADTNIDGEYVFKAHFEDNRVQIGLWDWFAGKLTAGDFLRGFTCGIATGTTNFCDPAFEALVAEADTLQLNDPAAAIEKWAAADRMIVDLAVWAPLYNEGSDLISTRVSNYQFHSLYGALLDQMWVQ